MTAASKSGPKSDAKSGPDFSRLYEVLGYTFQRPDLLALALTHASANVRDRTTKTNERLEFLGDRVLSLAAAEMLLERFPDEPEGDIAKRHSALVRNETLVEIGREIRLGVCITAGRKINTEEPSIIADALEAVIAAVYLDGGWEPARALIKRFWATRLEHSAAAAPPRDAKSRLQEWLQGQGCPLPAYRMVTRSGPPQAPVFKVEVRAKKHAVQGEGGTKRAAEQAAATLMLGVLNIGTAP
ncbi:MAG: ribonuclease III [Rhodospirillales bacterium]